MLSINEKFRQIKKLGRGSFGLVWQVEDKESGKSSALKVVKLDESVDSEKARREVDNVRTICANDPHDPRQRHIIQIENDWEVPDPRHPEIQKWIDDLWFQADVPVARLLVIQMEFCDQSLQAWLKNPVTNGNLDEGRNIFHQITQGLSFLHDQNCIHRDLKPDNILLTKINDGEGQVMVAKISDFGSSRIRHPNSASILTYAVGADIYASPEQFNQRRNPGGFFKDYTTKSDIFSLGIIFFCIHYPLKKSYGPEAHQYYQHLEGFRQEDTKIPEDFCIKLPDETELLRRMLSNDPNGRPTAHEIDSTINIFKSKLTPYQTEEFGESEKNELLKQIAQSTSRWGHLLVELDIELISDCGILMSFLHHTASDPALKISLKVDTIKSFTAESTDSGKWPLIKFPQVTSLNILCLKKQIQLECLVQLVKNCPNLRQLSVGNFEWLLRDPQTSFENISQFLEMGLLQNMEFSCDLFTDDVDLQTVAQLKRNGVTVKKLGFYRFYSHQSRIIDLVQGDLEEIQSLYLDDSSEMFQSTLDKLRILDIRCSWPMLSSVLEKAPNIQKLIYRTDAGQPAAVNVEQVSLPRLTSLTVYMYYKEDPERVAFQLSNFPNLCQLTCINYKNASMKVIYEAFRHVKEFRYLQGGGVSIENVVGLSKFASELTSLSFGYKDYQPDYHSVYWDLDTRALKRVIGGLKKLKKLCLPPMSLKKAKEIVKSLAPLRILVQFQVWSGQDTGYGDTMTTYDTLKCPAIGGLIIEVIKVRRETIDRTYFY